MKSPNPPLELNEEERHLLDAMRKKKKLAILNKERLSEEELDYLFIEERTE